MVEVEVQGFDEWDGLWHDDMEYSGSNNTYTHLLSSSFCTLANPQPLFVSLVFPIISLQMIPSFSNPSDFPVLACCLKDCMENVGEWMGDSKLKMNDDKTEPMAIGTRSKLSQIIPNLAPMSIFGCDIPFSQSVRRKTLWTNLSRTDLQPG